MFDFTLLAASSITSYAIIFAVSLTVGLAGGAIIYMLKNKKK